MLLLGGECKPVCYRKQCTKFSCEHSYITLRRTLIGGVKGSPWNLRPGKSSHPKRTVIHQLKEEPAINRKPLLASRSSTFLCLNGGCWRSLLLCSQYQGWEASMSSVQTLPASFQRRDLIFPSHSFARNERQKSAEYVLMRLVRPLKRIPNVSCLAGHHRDELFIKRGLFCLMLVKVDNGPGEFQTHL